MAHVDLATFFDGVITHPGPHLFRINFDTWFDDCLGNFSYSGQNIDGTIQQIKSYIGGHLSLSISNLSVDAHVFQQLALTGNIAAVPHLLFSGNDVFSGDGLNDRLLGYDGNDTMNGGGGNDVVKGMAGDDRISGGSGNDILVGGPGNDTFVFRPGFGKDVITDFSAGPAVGDVIEMHGLFHSLVAVRNHSHIDAAHHLVIVVDAADTITLNAVHSKAALSPNDFHLFA